MAGARFWVVQGPGLAVDDLSARAAARGRRTVLLPAALPAALPWDVPDLLLVPAPESDRAGADFLAACAALACPLVFLARPGRPAIPGVTDLGAVSADGLLLLLESLSAGDRLAGETAVQRTGSQALLETFPGAVVICDAEGRLVFANSWVGRRSGRDPMSGRCFEILHGRDAPCPWCQRARVLAGETVTQDVQSPLDGLYFRCTIAPVRLPGRPPLALAFFLDITERYLAQSRVQVLGRDLERRVAERTELLAKQTRALSEANARLMELDALKSGFLDTVTHDLRTPLTSVLGFAKLTRRDFIKEFMPFCDVSDQLAKKGSRIADNLRIIENEGGRLTRLVNDFLDLSKIESGRLDWHDRLIAPAEVVRMAVDAVSGEYEQNAKLVLVVDVGAALPPLRVDPDRLTQVLVNLLTNAARHAREGDVLLTAGRLATGRVEFRVADDGPGIPQAERERIFDKFHQVRRGDTTLSEQRGTGLGLAICKHIVERYAGEIRAEPKEPHGTVFVVELPVCPGSPLPDAGPEDSRSRPESAVS